MNLAEGAVSYIPLTINDGAKVTEAYQLEDGVYPVGFFHPIINTSVAVNFNVKRTESDTLVPMNDGGSPKAITINPAAASYEPLIPLDFVGVKWIQLAVADNQTGAKVIYLAVRGI